MTRSPPPLLPTGLVLHRDGHLTHEGQPIRNARLRGLLERSVCYLADEGVYGVRVGRFRGAIEVEDTAFFVRMFDAASGRIDLRDGSSEPLRVDSLEETSEGVLYCLVKGDHRARFTHAAQAHLLDALEVRDGQPWLRLSGRSVLLAPRPIA